ncbi:ATP-binding protein [Persicimonas caeni]|nr:AAA family ATPase [Persicimonas caeni]
MSLLDQCMQEAPLVTIAGTGGMGKTRLAMNYAASTERFEQVVMVDVAKARTLDEFLTGVTEALEPVLEAMPGAGSGRIERLGHALASLGDSLILVDNLEQVVDPAAHAMRQWLEIAPEVSFLATSREALRLRGERLIRLSPLPEDEAVELFAHRARQVRPEFDLDETNRAAVAEIVRYLDAVPLAVELAAARVNVVAPADILERLTGEGGGLHTLIRKTRHATVRHQSMHATLYWSWELLEPEEREVLAGASVFRGSFDLPAAEAVLETDAPVWVGDVLESLVDKSLVVTRRAPGSKRGALRFQLFATTREFADTMLEGERRDELERRHARYFAERLANSKKLRRAEDLANVEKAFWASLGTDDATAARLALGAYRLRRARDGHSSRQLEVVDAALGGAFDDPKLRAKLLGARARCYYAEGRYTEALADVDAGLDAAAQVDATARRAHLLYRKGTVLRAAGKPSAARQPLREALELADSLRDAPAIVKMRQIRAIVDYELGDFDSAAAELAHALELARRHAIEALEARVLVDLCRCQVPTGDLESAAHSLDGARSIDTAAAPRFQMRWLEAHGELEWYRGHNKRAYESFRRALDYASKEDWSKTSAGRRLNPLRFGLSALDATDDETSPEAYLRTVLQTVWDTEDIPDRVQARTRLAIIHLRRGEFREAVRLMRLATGEVDALESGRLRAHVRCWAAVAEAALGGRERAERLLDEARAGFEELGARALLDDVAYFLRAGDCLGQEGHASALELDDIVEDLSTRAKERRFQPQARIWRWVCYDHLLELAELFESAANSIAPQEGLMVARDGSAFRLPDGEHVDLSSRQALSLILAELARRRAAGEDDGISVDALSQVGWPDEKLTKSAGSSRVYTAIRTLRTMGLDGILLTGREGYVLDPELDFAWLE